MLLIRVILLFSPCFPVFSNHIIPRHFRISSSHFSSGITIRTDKVHGLAYAEHIKRCGKTGIHNGQRQLQLDI
jgi:hypothetical protein